MGNVFIVFQKCLKLKYLHFINFYVQISVEFLGKADLFLHFYKGLGIYKCNSYMGTGLQLPNQFPYLFWLYHTNSHTSFGFCAPIDVVKEEGGRNGFSENNSGEVITL